MRESAIARLPGDDPTRTLAVASLLGATSSSCSYAAVAVEFTNLVIVLLVLLFRVFVRWRLLRRSVVGPIVAILSFAYTQLGARAPRRGWERVP